MKPREGDAIHECEVIPLTAIRRSNLCIETEAVDGDWFLPVGCDRFLRKASLSSGLVRA